MEKGWVKPLAARFSFAVCFMIDAASVIAGHHDPETGNAAQTGGLYLDKTEEKERSELFQ